MCMHQKTEIPNTWSKNWWNGWIYSYNWRLQFPILNNQCNNRTENQHGYRRAEPHHLPTCSNIYRTLYLTRAKFKLFSNIHGMFIKRDHILGHKTNLNKFKRIKIIQSGFSSHDGIKLGINNSKIGKSLNAEKRNNPSLNDLWVQEEVSREIQIIRRT